MSSSSMFCSAYEELPSPHLCDGVDKRHTDDLVPVVLAVNDASQQPAVDAKILPPPESWFQDDDVVLAGAAGELDATVAVLECPLSDSLQADTQLAVPNTAAASKIDGTLPASAHTSLEQPKTMSRNSESHHDTITLTHHTVAPTHVKPNHAMPAGTPPQPQSPFIPVDHSTTTLSSLVGAPLPSPSWQDVPLQLLPAAARELLLATVDRVCYTARWSYAGTRWHRKYNDLNTAAGYYRSNRFHQFHSMENSTDGSDAIQLSVQLPPFSSLPWVDRQMVKEWRTYLPHSQDERDQSVHSDGPDEEELEFDRARTLVPPPATPPVWKKAEACMTCHRTFGPTSLRHHCRLCGGSYCQAHSARTHSLPHLGFHPQVPERVCDGCKEVLLQQNLAERITWRLARCRDYQESRLQPYFDIGLDSVDQIVLRITNAALTMAKAIPLGAQATVAVETVDVLRKYGLNGIYTIMLRQEFLAAADLLLKALGINRTAWPLSVHELSAAIFYALAQHRAMRGMNPDREDTIHAVRDIQAGSHQRDPSVNSQGRNSPQSALLGGDSFMGEIAIAADASPTATAIHELPVDPVCDPVSNEELSSLIFYAPIALNFIYVEKEVDMQLLAAQQGWRLLYAYLDQEVDEVHVKLHDRPASALFVHTEEKIACLAVRGTTTIHDVVTDVRQVPVPFPDMEHPALAPKASGSGNAEDEWTAVHQGLAVAGMAGAAANLYREHIDTLLALAKQGYRIRMTGHSLGGSVAVLLGVLVNQDLLKLGEQSQIESYSEKDCMLRVYSYGTPSCVDLPLAEAVESFVTTVVLHDDVVPRLTPTSCRGLLKHLLHIRETWVKVHFADDLRAFTDRAKTAWAPRWRPGFTLSASSSVNLKRLCRQQLHYGKKQLRKVKDKLVGDDQSSRSAKSRVIQHKIDKAKDRDAERSSVEKIPSSSLFAEPTLVMDVLGGMGAGSEGMVVDGDEFFESGENLLYTSDEENDLGSDVLNTPSKICPDDDAAANQLPGSHEDSSECDDGQPVFLDELPLPRMFIPGRIVHVYSHRGVYKAAYVPRTFRELRRISMAGNMLSDHKTKSYHDALLEVANVRSAPESPPQWTAYDEDDTCSCCASRFTWASTSDNEAQQARDKHNCRSCGSLVCDSCAQNRIPVPSIGLTAAVRVCDRCYYDISGLVHTGTGETLDGKGNVTPSTPEGEKGAPTRQRQKRSVVVDDLARRVQASGLACT